MKIDTDNILNWRHKMKKEVYELRDTGEQFKSMEELLAFCKKESRLTASCKKIITETKEEYDDVAIQYDDKIVFSYYQEDFDYCRDAGDILSVLVDVVNQQLKSRGVNIQVVLDQVED